MQQLLYDVTELLWQRLANLGACVFAGNVPAYLHQLVQCDVVPVVDVLFCIFHQFQLLLGIIDERAQLAFLVFTK